MVAIQNILQQIGGVGLNLQLAVGNGRVDEAVADDFAHGGLGGAAHQGIRFVNVEEVGHGIGDAVLHAELHVDDVFVAGEHGGFGKDGAHLSLLVGAAFAGGAIAHLAAQHPRHLRLVDGFNGHRQGIMGAGADRAVVLSEAQDDACFAGIDDIDARQQPDDQQDQRAAADEHALRQAEFRKVGDIVVRAAAADLPEAAFLAFAVEVVEIVTVRFRRSGAISLLLFPLFLQFVPVPVHAYAVSLLVWWAAHDAQRVSLKI